MTRTRDLSDGIAIDTGTAPTPAGEMCGATILLLPPRAHLPELRDIVAEGTRALALLDVPRLEELALACRRFNGDPVSAAPGEGIELTREAREACGDMAVFARVLEATRANLAVMHRLRDLREGRLEYGRPLPESTHGND